jgi:sigma-B regulation protein RsbU (phosphoserine phosphatase)
MEHHESKRLPLSVLYGLLGLLFVWAAAYRLPMTRDVFTIVFRPGEVVATPFLADWPDGVIQFTAADLDEFAAPPLRRGDRVVSIDGLPFRTAEDVLRRAAALGPRGTMHVVVARKTPAGAEERIVSTVALRSNAAGRTNLASRVFIAILGIVVPWLCLLVGFWVAAVRPRDPVAWLVLFMLLGFAQLAGVRQYTFATWPDVLRTSAAAYANFFGTTWPMWFCLFGVHFAGRLDGERRYGWIKWIILAPLAVFATAAVVGALAENLDLRGAAPAVRAIAATDPARQIVSMIAVSMFFFFMGWKSGVASGADARRRLTLLLWGGCIALLPLLVLIVAERFFGRPVDALPAVVIFGCLMVVAVFPLTLAYVILVHRAMEVRVAVRQGLRYAATRGAIRTVVMLFMGGVLWNAWNLVNDPTANRPRKLQAIAWGMAAAIVAPRFAKGAFGWTDRRFFREAYDVERVLTELSEQVRTIAETEPLLDTVLDRIGTTLHVDRLAVFLHEGDRLVPSRSRGFDPPPTVDFPAGTGAIVRLRESGRPLRVRRDDPESPLRREQISEDFRARLAAVEAELVLPLNGKKDLLGVITLGPKKSEEPYSISDAKLLGSVASQTGLALENSRLMATIVSEIAKREWIGREIDIARGVQQRLFPQKLPEITGVDCAGFCRPAQGVGGDYYDFLALSGGRLGLALGDVAGKGIPAALLMASLQASLRGQRLSGPADLAQLMTNLNFLIHEASPDNRYATFFYGELDPATRRLDYVNAGHNAPMIFRAAGGIERLRATGPVVGLVEAGQFEQRSVVLSPSDVLLVYSDGISEAMNGDDEEWGEDNLALAAGAAFPCGAQELIDRLFIAADAHAAGAMQHDDMTVVAVRMKA